MKCPEFNEEIGDCKVCPFCKYNWVTMRVEDNKEQNYKKTHKNDLNYLFKIKIFLQKKSLIIESILLTLLIVVIIFYNVVKEEKNQLTDEITNIKEENSELSEKVDSYYNQIKILGKNEKQQELNEQIQELETKQEELSIQKTELESQIQTLSEEVAKAKGEPKNYSAGHLTAGIDVPTGKYKIYGGSSNFVVYSAYGSLKVNIILGGSYGVSEYIYTFEEGDKIEANSAFKLVAVE